MDNNGVEFCLREDLDRGTPCLHFCFLSALKVCQALFAKLLERGLYMELRQFDRGLRFLIYFFADDSLIFCKAKIEDCSKLADILKCYEKASGQMINLDKSGIMFSSNTCNGDREVAMNILNIHRILENEQYLGLPLMFGRSKKRVFKDIKGGLGSRIQGWGKRLLSKAGKAILIQTVAQAMPVYVMNCFKLPKSFLHEFDMMVAGYC